MEFYIYPHFPAPHWEVVYELNYCCRIKEQFLRCKIFVLRVPLYKVELICKSILDSHSKPCGPCLIQQVLFYHIIFKEMVSCVYMFLSVHEYMYLFKCVYVCVCVSRGQS